MDSAQCLQKIAQQGFGALAAVVETRASFGQVKTDEFCGQAAVLVRPVLGVAPETFDAVDVVAADRPVLLAANPYQPMTPVRFAPELPKDDRCLE